MICEASAELRQALIHVAAKAKDLGLPGGRFPFGEPSGPGSENHRKMVIFMGKP